MRPHLLILKGPKAGAEIPLDRDVVEIGYDTANHIIVQDDSVSGKHARIAKSSDGWIIEDLNSTNGVYIQNTPVPPGGQMQLADGDSFRLGRVVLRFLYEQHQEPAPKAVFAKNKVLFIGAVAVLLFFILLAISAMFAQQTKQDTSQTEHPNLSDVPITLPASGVYGNNNRDQTHPDQVIFVFDTQPGRVTLGYTAGSIDYTGEVVILLNGHKVGNVPVAMGDWGQRQEIVLQENLFNQQGRNTITFNHVGNPPANKEWGVKDVDIRFLASDVCREDLASQALERAREYNSKKRISPGNLYYAIEKYREAYAHLVRCPLASSLASTVESELKQAETSLNEQYASFRFAFRKYLELNDRQNAIEALEEILHIIPNPEDARHHDTVALINKYKQTSGGAAR